MRAAISAQLDGEELPVTDEVLEQHLVGCPACRAFRAEAAALNRQVRLRAAPPVPDLTRRILLAIGDQRRSAAPATQGLRVAVALLGLLQLGVSLPALIFGTDAGLPVHTARHLGSFGVALAVGLLVAAWKPQRIAGLLPLTAALVVCLIGSAVLDVTTGYAAVSGELSHTVELLGLVGLWLLARSPAVTTPNLSPA